VLSSAVFFNGKYDTKSPSLAPNFDEKLNASALIDVKARKKYEPKQQDLHNFPEIDSNMEIHERRLKLYDLNLLNEGYIAYSLK